MKRTFIVILAVALVVVASGCGNVAEKASEKAAEKIVEKSLEQQSGGDVDVDLSDEGGSVKIQSEEGTINIGGGEVPEGIGVPFPKGGNVSMSMETPDGATVMLQYPGADFDEIVAFYQDWADSSSEDFENVSYSASDLKSESWVSDSTSIQVQTCQTDEGDGVCVTVVANK